MSRCDDRRGMRRSMTGSTLIKVVLVLVLAIGMIVEVGSPVWARTDASGAATDAANAGARDLFVGHDMTQARQAAADAAAVRGDHLDGFDLLADGEVHVTVSHQAKSYVLYRFSAFKRWYDVKASAVATPH